MNLPRRQLFCVAAALLIVCSVARAGEGTNLLPPLDLRADSPEAKGWRLWTPRAELALPGEIVGTGGGAALLLTAERFEQYGKWIARVGPVEPGAYYRLEVTRQAKDITAENVSVFVLVAWYGGTENGDALIYQDVVHGERDEDKGRRHFRTVRAPAGAKWVDVELGLRWTEGGSVRWSQASLTQVAPPAPRKVRVATTQLRPQENPTVATNTKLVADLIDRAGPERPDVLLFSEAFPSRAVKGPLRERAQTVPGPFTEMLSEKARKYGLNIIAGLVERAGDHVYNSAVWIDRTGRIAGKYRKVHLTIGEADKGLTPGSDYPVFDTDFGRMGILICWDNWFSEPARIMRLQGAELLFVPLAADGQEVHWDAISRARAIDNGLYLVTSGTWFDGQSVVMSPTGEVLGQAEPDAGYVITEVDLDAEYRIKYMGEGEVRFIHERRPDTYRMLTEGRDHQLAPVPARE